uniref:Ephrin_rec_like domain-containing protein n=1 Tax=Macrostomum lignano TaxID=282301 RepID=A0A1I8FVR0_9PLAT
LLQLLQMDQTLSAAVVGQFCSGAMELKKSVQSASRESPSADSGAAVCLLEFDCHDGVESDAYYITATSLNMSQLVRDVMSIFQLPAGGSGTLVSQIMGIFGDPSWANSLKLNATQAPSASLAMLSRILDQSPFGPTERSALLFGTHFLLLQVEALKMKTTLQQEFTKFVLTDSRVAAWVSSAAAAFPGTLVQQSLLTVPTHVYMFAGLSSSAEVKRHLCDSQSLAQMVDPDTRAILIGNGSATADAAKAAQLFCNNSDVFIALCDMFKAKQDAVMARGVQLSKLTNFSALPDIADGFAEWTKLAAEQQLLQWNGTWTQQAIAQLSARCISGLELQGVVINLVAAYHMVDVAKPPVFWWWRLPVETVVANMHSQTAGMLVANIWASSARRDALMRAIKTPEGATVVGLSLQLGLQMMRSPPPASAMLVQQPKLPMCNGSYLTDYLPVVANYPAGAKLNSSLCVPCSPPDLHAVWELTVKSWASMIASNSNGSAHESLTRALLMNMNQQQLFQYAVSHAQQQSTLNFGLPTTQMQLLSLAYELFYNAATANATDPVYTRDLQQAVLSSPELSELMSSLTPAVKDLMRAALAGSLTISVPPAGSANATSICVVGGLPTVRRFSSAFCAAYRAMPGRATAKFGPLMQLFEPASRAALSVARFNVTADWMLNSEISQLISDLSKLQIVELLPASINATDISSFANQFVADFNTLLSSNLTSLLDTFGQVLMKQLQSSPLIGPQVQQYVNSATQLYDQLIGLLKASNYSATGLVSGTELSNLVALFNQAPGLLPTVLKTVFDAQANPSGAAAAWTPVLADPSLLCSNLTVFQRLLHTPDTVDSAALQGDLCRAVGFNSTALLAQVFQRLPAIKLLVDQLNCLTTGCVPDSGNATSAAEFFAAMQAATAEFQALVTKFNPGGIRLEIFNSSYMAMLLGPELQRFVALGSSSLDAQLPAYLKNYGNLIVNLMSSMNMSMDSNMEVVMKLLQWHQALLDIIIGGPARLEAMLNQTADGQRLWRLLINLPALTQVVTHTSTQYPARIAAMQTALTASFNATALAGAPSVMHSICKLNLSDFLVVPPGVSFDPQAFQEDFCSLNLTNPATLPPPLNTLFSMTGTVGLKPESLMKAMYSMSSGNWSTATQLWMPFLQQWSAAITSTVSATPSVQMAFYQLDSVLANLPPSVLQPVNGVMSIVNYLLDFSMASVNHLLTTNSSSVADGLYQLPETQKLLQLVSENFTDILVAAASNQRPIQYLLTLNETDAFMYLCLSQNASLMAALGMNNFSFVSPPGVCVGCLVEKLCTVNIAALLQETNEFGTSLAGKWGSASKMSFVVLGDKAMQLQALVMQLAAKSSVAIPGMFQSANWNPALMLLAPKVANGAAILDSTQELLFTVYLSIKDPKAQAAFATLLSDVLGQWAPRLESFIATKNLYAMFKGLPILDALYNITAADGGTATLRVVLMASAYSPKKVAELILNPTAAADAFGKLCNGSLDLASLLVMDATEDTRSVQQALCSVFSDVENVNALTTRLVQQLGLSSLFGAPGSVGNASSTTNITAVQAQAQMFFQKLQALTATSSAGLLPQLNLAVYSELITYVTNGRPADQQMVLEYYTTLYTLLKTYLPAADFLRVQDVIASSMSFLKALLQYTGAAIQGPGSLELSNLVANISSAQTVLDQLLKPHNLTGLQVVTGKLAQLYILVMSNASILCSMDPNEYFVLPATLDAKALQDGLCRLSSNFQMEIMGNMDLMKLMQAVSSLAMPNKTVDFNLVWQFYGTLINQTALLARPRNVTYRGVLVSDLLQMTSPDLQKLFPDIITISGQLNLIFGVAETVATSLDSMISKDPVAATILKITHAALSTVQSILKSWAQAGELNLSVVFRNATLWTELFTNTTVGVGDISALVNVTLRVDKLAILFSKPMDIPSTICNSTNGFSTYFAIGAAVPALDKVFYYIFCDQAAQNRLRIEFLDQMGISAILEASATSGNGTSVSLKDAVAQVRQLVNQVGLVIQRPLVFNTNGTVIDSLIKLLGSDVIAQLGKLLQDQFAQPTAALNFLPPVLEAAYSLFKSSMPKETAQLDLGIAVAYEIIARTNAEVTNMLGKAITLETLLRPDNVLSPLLKSLDATDANTLTLLVRATLNNSEFNRWLAMGFTNALCKEDLNRLFVSTVPMNLSALQSSICTLANSSALMSALGSMFNDKNSLFEMLTTMTVRQSVSVTNMYTMILQLSGSLQGLGSVNSTALDAKILSMISSLQAGSAGLVANYKAYLTGSLSAMGQLTLRTGDLALLGAVAGKLEQSVGLLSAIHRMVTGQASPAAFVQILSAIVADQRLAATVVLARGAQPAVAEMCGKLNSVFPSAADAAAVNASFCQSPADAWWQAKISPTAAADQIFVYLTGENATVTTLPWKTFEPTLTSVISLGELLTAAPATLSNVTIPTLLTALQQLSMQQTLGPTLAMIITQQVSSTDQAIMQRTLEISVMFMSVLLTAHRDNLTNALVQPGALNQLMLVSNSGYFRTELEVLLANPEYAMLSGGELNATLCDIDQFQTTLPYVRWSIAAQMMLSPNDTRAYLCEGAQKDMLMLQQLEKFANLSKLIKLANSFKGMSIAKLMQELLSGNFSIAGVSQVFADPSGLLNVFTQLGQSLMMPMNSTSSGASLQQHASLRTNLFVVNGTAVKLNEMLATLTNNTSLIEAALCDLAVVDLAGAASKLTQLIKLAATPGRPSTLDCVSFANLFTSSRIGTSRQSGIATADADRSRGGIIFGQHLQINF